MFQRFTDRARRVVVLAQEEARLLNHNYVGTEHLLLGLIHEDEGVGSKALASLGVTLPAARSHVERIIGQGGSSASGNIPFTPRAKKVIELSLREALQLGHNYVDTEHLLLGLVREGEGVAAQVMVELGADVPRVRQQVMQLLSDHRPGEVEEAGELEPYPPVPMGPRCSRCGADLAQATGWLGVMATNPPRHPEAESRRVTLVYCGSCGAVLGVLRGEEAGS